MKRFTPPPINLGFLIAAVTAIGLAGPALAQVLPEISIQIAPGFQNGFSEGSIKPCNNARGGLPVQIHTSSGAQGVTANTLAYTVSGHDRLYDVRAPAHISPANEGPAVYRSRGAASHTSNSTGWFPLAAFGSGAGSPCFPDDRPITGGGIVKVIPMPGAGHAINPDMREVEPTVHDNVGETCGNERTIEADGGILYKVNNGNLNDTCVRTTETAVLEAYGESESYLKSSQKWRTDSTSHCPESPYQGWRSLE